MQSWIIVLAFGASLVAVDKGLAQGGHAGVPLEHQERPRSEAAAARWPQAVRVGDLVGRQVLENVPQQRVLGRVTGVARDADGHISIQVTAGGLWGLGGRQVAVPVEATALLGPFLVAMELDAHRLAALPQTLAPPSLLLPVNAAIRIGLTRN